MIARRLLPTMSLFACFAAAVVIWLTWTGNSVFAASDGTSLRAVNGSVTARDGQSYSKVSTVNGDVRIGRGASADEAETVNGSKVFVIEGAIAPTSRKAVEIPRLRFVVQDARGTDIYAWNSVVDQAVIQPGERVAFKSRLASPPADAHSLVVRFFNRRDLTAGSV